MGLDFLDIVFRIEKTFDLKLSQGDLATIARDDDVVVGDLYDFLRRKLWLRDFARNDLRLNYALWAGLQGVLCSVTQTRPEQVELKTPLATLFPRSKRRDAWEAMRDACPYRIPKLDYPAVVRFGGFVLAVAMALMEQFQFWQVPGAKWLWPLLGILGIWMLVETYTKVLWVLAPLRRRFPSGIATVKDLCRTVLATNYENICRDVEIPLDDRYVDVWEQLVGILVDALGVDREEVTFHARLVKDLAMA